MSKTAKAGSSGGRRLSSRLPTFQDDALIEGSCWQIEELQIPRRCHSSE